MEEIDVNDLEWLLDIPFWSSKDGQWTLSANQFMANPEKFERHNKRMQNADTKYPIPIMKNKNGKWLLLDGTTKVKVMKIPRSEIGNVSL